MNAGGEICQTVGAIDDGGVESDAPAVDAQVDRDHDGILDAVDNCPDVANVTQVDEDSDGLGDVCDPCPPFADNQDSDGDEVGDACDPDPAHAGDQLVAFDGFDDALSGSWTVMGTFTMTGGEGVLSATDTSTSLLTRPSPAGARVEVRAAFVIDSITAAGLNLGSISVIERMPPNTDKSIACQLAGLAAGTQEYLRIFDAASSAEVASGSYAFAPGDAKELRLGRDGTSYTCTIASPTANLQGTAAFAPALRRSGCVFTARWRAGGG